MVGSLLDATEQVLRSHGYVGASTNRIARSARVSVGSLYQYFGDKDGLIGAALERALAREAEGLSALAEQARSLPLAEGVARLVDALVRSRIEQRALLAVLAEHGPRLGPGTSAQHLARLQRGHPDPLQRLVAGRRSETRESGVETIAFASSALLDTASFAYAVSPPPNLRSDALVRLLSAAVAEHLVATPLDAVEVPDVRSIEVGRVRSLLQASCTSSAARAALLDELVYDEQAGLTALTGAGAAPEVVCEGMLRFWSQSARELVRAAGASALTGPALEPDAWQVRAERRERGIRSWLGGLHGSVADDIGQAAVFLLSHAFLELGLLFAQAREPAEIVDARVADAAALLARCARLVPQDALTSSPRHQ